MADFERMPPSRDLLAAAGARLSGRVGFEDGVLTVRAHQRLADAAANVELEPASGIVESFREVKDPDEVAAMRAAAEIADQTYADLAEQGIRGRTEKRIAFDLERRMRELGADDRAFQTIVASGAKIAAAAPRDCDALRRSSRD